MVFVARGLTVEAFGTFTLVYTALLFANAMQFALIVQPHQVLAVVRRNAEYAPYTASTLAAQVGLILFASVALLFSATLLRGSYPLMAWALVLLIPALLGWQLQEFMRRVLYAEKRLNAAFANDCLSYGGQVIVILVLWYFHLLTIASAILGLAATSVLAAIWGCWQVRSSLTARVDVQVIRENWHFGKWLGGEQLSYWLSSQAYFYLVAALISPAATGALKAAFVLAGPLNILLTFLDSVLPAQFSRSFARGGHSELATEVKRVFLLTLPVVALYCGLLTLFADNLLPLVFGAQYAGYTTLVVFVALLYVVMAPNRVLSPALRAKRITRPAFIAQTVGAAVTLTVGWLLVRSAGPVGAILGMILSTVIATLVIWCAYRRSGSGSHQRSPHPEGSEINQRTDTTMRRSGVE